MRHDAPARSAISQLIRDLERIIDEYDNDLRGRMNATRRLLSDGRFALNGQNQAAEALRQIELGEPIMAIGIVREILQGLKEQAAA